MSQDQQSSQQNVSSIEIASSTKTSVVSKNGCLKFQLRQADFQSVVHLLWRAILKDVNMKGLSNTWNAATCQSYEKKLSK